MIRFNGSNNGDSYKIVIETNHAELFFAILDIVYRKKTEEKSKKQENSPEKTV